MKAKNLFMALAAVAALGAGAAHAGGVFWQVGVGQPGVQVAVGNMPHPVYAPAPVLVAPQPVYYQAPPVAYMAPRVVVGAPVVQTAWVEPRFYGYGRDWRAHEWHERMERERFEHRGWDRR